MEQKITWPYGQTQSLEEGIKTIQEQVGPGWSPLLERLVTDLFAMGWDGEVHQVKEKFGGLRFYIGGASDAVHTRIRQAEREAAVTCEDCGQPGKIQSPPDISRYWLRTLCTECEAKR